MDKSFVIREESELPIKRKEVIQNPQVTQVGAQEEVEDKDDLMDKENIIAKVTALPKKEDIDFPFEEHLIVELYSK